MSLVVSVSSSVSILNGHELGPTQKLIYGFYFSHRKYLFNFTRALNSRKWLVLVSKLFNSNNYEVSINLKGELYHIQYFSKKFPLKVLGSIKTNNI